ncbi:MAG TPA: response regulator transcription factor [Candidatus Methylomirabilis sp.]
MVNTRVLIVDDHPVVRQGLRSLLSEYPDIQIVGETEGDSTVLELCAQLRPDVILLDIRLAGSNGLDLARQLRSTSSEAHVIILTSYDDETYLREAVQAGVHGYLLKSASAEVLADAIRVVHAGERRISPPLINKVMQQLEELSRAQVQAASGLSDQELQLLKLIAEGASTPDMVRALYLSDRTVKRKIRDILAKLGATSRAQAVAEAYRRGLL